MHDLIVRGKVLYWGTSEWSGAQIAEVCNICDEHNLYRPQAEQPQYSMLYRKRVEDDVLPVTHPRGIGLVAFSPLAMGMLTGKYDDGVPAGTRFANETWAKERFFNDANVEKVRRLKAIADSLGLSRSQLALAWVLRHPGISSVITGATHVAQVEENVGAADTKLGEDVISQIETILSA
jgi:aryl-alcohol dehydrogenase-like predicted oxidoreductase